jgi:hypothetical protein
VSGLPATFEGVAEFARRMKRERVQNYGDAGDPAAADLRNFVMVVRDGEQRVVVWAGPGPDAARSIVYWSAALLQPDELYLVADTVMRLAPPDALEDPGQGAVMQPWLGGEREGMIEALAVQRYPALGPTSWHLYPYECQGKVLRWVDLDKWVGHPATELGNIGGAIPDYARQGYNDGRQNAPLLARIRATAASVVGGLPAAEGDYHFARALARLLCEKEGVGAVQLLEPEQVVFVAGEGPSDD